MATTKTAPKTAPKTAAKPAPKTRIDCYISTDNSIERMSLDSFLLGRLPTKRIQSVCTQVATWAAIAKAGDVLKADKWPKVLFVCSAERNRVAEHHIIVPD